MSNSRHVIIDRDGTYCRPVSMHTRFSKKRDLFKKNTCQIISLFCGYSTLYVACKISSLQSIPQTYLPLHAQNLDAIVKQYIVTIENRADGCPISEKIPVRISWEYDINCNCLPNYNRFYV